MTHEKNEIVVGLVGGFVHSAPQEVIESVQELFETMLSLPKTQQHDFYQHISFDLALKSNLFQFLTAERSLLINLMRGLNAKIDLSIFKRVDDILIELFKLLS